MSPRAKTAASAPTQATQGQLVLRSPAATRRLGRRLGALLQPGDFVALTGDLGAGKTLFVRGAAEGAGVPEDQRATSPTFALVHLYGGGRVPVQHLDLYRLGGGADLFALGFDDLLSQPAATLCEWADRAGDRLPPERLDLAFTGSGGSLRTAELRAHGPRAAVLLEALLGRRAR